MTSDTATLVPPAQERLATTPSRAASTLFAATSLLSAFLLFQVQLIVSKHILPWFGGSAAVWTTSLLVFQLLLLAGYGYSHLVSVRLSAAAQARLHATVLAVSFVLILTLSLFWPSAVTPGAGWRSLYSGTPAAAVAAIVLLSAGLPFFVLSTTQPLLQSWFARLGGGPKAYKLYSVSNLGSLLGLLTFPFLIEPTLRIQMQGRIWSILFCLFACGCGLCAWRALRAPYHTEQDEAEDGPGDAATGRPSAAVVGLWVLLAACASALLLATTNLLCQEIVSLPLVWVLPLAVYLLSFILCFDHPRWYKRAVFHPLFAVAFFLTCAAVGLQQFLVQVVTLPVLLFVTCMICHGELFRLKPAVKSLTAFYLAISAGGAAGGIFVAVIAPQVFTSFLEFQLTLAAAVILICFALLRDRQSWLFRSAYWLPPLIVGGALLAAYGASRLVPELSGILDGIRYYPVVLLIGTLVVLGALVMERGVDPGARRFRFVHVLVAAIVLFSFAALHFSTRVRAGLYLRERSFYGVISVFRYSGLTELVHGQTTHGTQLNPPSERYPTAYYAPNSGIGLVLQNHPKRREAPGTLRVGVVGLGVGTLAAYGRPGDSIRYYEINSDVVKLSSGEQPLFTYLRDSAASTSVALGDARLSLEREANAGERQKFDVLALDAFTGDAVPVHLLTKEAFETYWQHVDPASGIIAVHITSRHVNLGPVLMGAAAHFGAAYLITYNVPQFPAYASGWFLMTRNPELLRIPGLEQITVRYKHSVQPRLWTDDYSDIIRLLY